MWRIILYIFVIQIYNIGEIICYNGLFAYKLKTRKLFWLRLGLCIAGMLVIAFLFAIGGYYVSAAVGFDLGYMSIFSVVMHLIGLACTIVTLYICFEEKSIILLFSAIAGKAAQTVAGGLYRLLLYITGSYNVQVALLEPIDFFSVFFYIVAHAVTCLVVWYFFVRVFNRYRKEFDATLNGFVIVLFTVILFFVIVYDMLVSSFAYDNLPITVAQDAMNIPFGIVILCIQRYLLYWMLDKTKSVEAENFHRNYKAQVEQTLKNMELVNIKCHDLKHQIRAMLDNRNLDESFIKEVQKSISIYDTHISTGNERLDVILTEKSLQCDVNHIQFTAMIDGGALDFLSMGDINSLFGNILDNAIEYLQNNEKEEDRFIRLSSAKNGNCFTVRCENYCSKELMIDSEGFPETTKADKQNHGFGVRSMREIVERNGGSLDFRKECNLFSLTVLFFI